MISVLTKAGKKINADSLVNGEKNYIEFTRLAIGEGTQEITEDIESLKKQVLSLPIETKKTARDQVMIRGIFNTGEIKDSFYYKEVGLFSRDKDSGGEVLYWYGNHGDKAEYIQSESQSLIEKIIDVYIKIDNAEKVVMSINNIQYETLDFEDYERTEVTELPTLYEALNSIKRLTGLSSLFSGVKAFLMGCLNQINDLRTGEADNSTEVFVTLDSAGWTGEEAPYSYTVPLEEATETNNIEINAPLEPTPEQYEQLTGAGIFGGTQTAGSITLSAYGDKPAIDLPVIILIRGD